MEVSDNKTTNHFNEGIGIDLGLKDFAIVSNGKTYQNINKNLKNLRDSLFENKGVFLVNTKN